jgi:hypothetical protein
MRIPYRMKAAINTYFAFQQRGWENAEQKDSVIKAIDKEARRYKINYEIVPGTVFLIRKYKTLKINKPILL